MNKQMEMAKPKRTRVKQPREWLPVEPWRQFVKDHDVKLDDSTRKGIKNEEWVELDMVERSIIHTIWLMEDIYGDDWHTLIVEAHTGPATNE